jgi:hypothetical protein
MSVIHPEGDPMYPLEGWVALKAEDHVEDRERGGCICGFCAWSPQHVAIMAYREACEAAVGRFGREQT